MNIRKRIIVRLFELSEQFYTRHFKKNKQPWQLSRDELLTYDESSFGRHLGLFLLENNFQLIPKVERHDAYHVLTGYGTKVEDEIALQYLCFGNGKRSPYLFGVIVIGTLLLPDYIPYYRRSFRRGKHAHAFHNWDFQKLLKTPIAELRQAVFPKAYIAQLRKSIQVSLK